MKQLEFPVLATKRLLLRELTIKDAPAIYHYLSDDEVIGYLEGCTENIEEAEGYVTWCRDTYQSGTDMRWGITLRESGELIGDCGLGHVNEPKIPTELGYILAKEHWHQGYMTEALNAILAYGFKTLNLHRIQAWTHPSNAASVRVLQKHGFRREGLLREYVFIWHKGIYIDVEMYSLLANEAKI